MANTKLIVLKSKEILYTAVFIGLVVLMIIILKSMFKPSADRKNDQADRKTTKEIATVQPDEDSATEEEAAADTTDTGDMAGVHYKPGTYSATLSMGDGSLNVMVTCNEESVTSVSLSNMDDAVKTMYPLMEETIQDINTQLEYVNSIDYITCSSDNVYTTSVICNAIKEALTAAVVE